MVRETISLLDFVPSFSQSHFFLFQEGSSPRSGHSPIPGSVSVMLEEKPMVGLRYSIIEYRTSKFCAQDPIRSKAASPSFYQQRNAPVQTEEKFLVSSFVHSSGCIRILFLIYIAFLLES